MWAQVLEWIRDQWSRGSRAIAIAASIVMILVVGEAAKCNVFGDGAYSIASRLMPWRWVCQQQAALDVRFSVLLPDKEKLSNLEFGGRCPVTSRIEFYVLEKQAGLDFRILDSDREWTARW